MKRFSKFILSLLLFMIVIPLSGNIPEENTIGDQSDCVGQKRK